MKDCLGTEITVGSFVAAPARSACIMYLKTGLVTRIVGDKVFIDWKKNRHYCSEAAKGYTELPKTLVVLD